MSTKVTINRTTFLDLYELWQDHDYESLSSLCGEVSAQLNDVLRIAKIANKKLPHLAQLKAAIDSLTRASAIESLKATETCILEIRRIDTAFLKELEQLYNSHKQLFLEE